MPIEKNIMQTWKTSDIPERWKESPVSIKQQMPDWNYTLMTDADNLAFVEKHFPQYLDHYINLHYNIQRADMIRPMWLYVNGGVYLDLDYIVNKPLDSLFTEDDDIYLIKSSNTSYYYTNSVMASKKEHPFWLEYLERMISKPPFGAFGTHLYVMLTTGPLALTDVAKRNNYRLGYVPHNEVIPCNLCESSNCNKKGYLKTIPGGSWNRLDSKIMNCVMCNYKNFGICLLLSALLVIFVINFL